MRGYDNEDTSPRHHEDVYEREMKLKCMAYPLAIPSTIRIGGVGLFKPNGTFHKHFNILEPSELPPYFNPLNTPIRPDDTCTYLEFEPHSFITSASIERCDDYQHRLGTRFRSSAAEGTIISLPAGALRTETKEISKFRDFIALNADNWARYLRDLGDRVLRLITGQLTAPYWGIASFERNMDINLTLSYSQSAEKEARYTWNALPSVRTTLSGKIRFSRPSDTLAVTSFTITPRGSGPPSAKVLSEDRMQEDPVAIIRHPCDYINERLLALSDKKFPNEALLIQRVFSSNELCHDEGIAFLRWKPKRGETASAADLLKEIDILRDTLDEIGDSNLVKRADCPHSITSNILTYLTGKASKNKDPRDSSFLLSNAMSNVIDEAKILSEIKRETAPSLHLFASTMWAKYVITGESKLLEQAISTRSSLPTQFAMSPFTEARTLHRDHLSSTSRPPRLPHPNPSSARSQFFIGAKALDSTARPNLHSNSSSSPAALSPFYEAYVDADADSDELFTTDFMYTVLPAMKSARKASRPWRIPRMSPRPLSGGTPCTRVSRAQKA
ncbi:hypothetical protein D9611_012681 [Ephemerocybe angulata]|uniref:Uncharacterized protein n=1 Tax=Ephemerocybe angulata TaxID=980116 RepID=A0A8H5B9J0_9AGAR|nr:hypothetical protein D9611_012681 [Tulosesus angulatus]